MFPLVTACLRETLKEALGTDYTPEVQANWEALSGVVEQTMIGDYFE